MSAADWWRVGYGHEFATDIGRISASLERLTKLTERIANTLENTPFGSPEGSAHDLSEYPAASKLDETVDTFRREQRMLSGEELYDQVAGLEQKLALLREENARLRGLLEAR